MLAEACVIRRVRVHEKRSYFLAVTFGLSTELSLYDPEVGVAAWATNLARATEAPVFMNPTLTGFPATDSTIAAIVVVSTPTRGHGMDSLIRKRVKEDRLSGDFAENQRMNEAEPRATRSKIQPSFNRMILSL
jgi:hypothetical protein